MKERPIIFNDEMVRAILSGTKTMTRRPVKGVMPDNGLWLKKPTKTRSGITTHVMDAPKHGLCPFGTIGDRLWVRETWARYNIDGYSHDMAYRAAVPNDWPEGGRWRPSIHMPRWASRITLEITGVRVERLQDITEDDARAEGISPAGELLPEYPDAYLTPRGGLSTVRVAFRRLWKSIYGDDSWNINPWVWVVEFKRVEESA